MAALPSLASAACFLRGILPRAVLPNGANSKEPREPEWLPRVLSFRAVARLNDTMGEDQAIEVLCHEWAQALAWNSSLDQLVNDPDLDPAQFDRKSHDKTCGCAYARVWRAYLEGGGADG